MRHIARSRGIKLELYARGRIRRSFEPLGATTRYDIAKLLSQSINELALRLPPQRRPWMTEDGRMALFDAAAMAVTYFRERDGDELPTIAA